MNWNIKRIKNFPYFVFSFLVLAIACNQQIKKEYYEFGQLKVKAKYQNGKLNGERKLYHKNGKLKEVAYYEDGKIEDTLRKYYPNGQLKLLAPFEGGKENGLVKIYRKTGKLKRVVQKINGKVQGMYKSYHKKGKLRIKALYENDTVVRFYQKFKTTGKLTEDYRDIMVEPESDTVRVEEPFKFKVSSYGPMNLYDSVRAGFYTLNIDTLIHEDSGDYISALFHDEKRMPDSFYKFKIVKENRYLSLNPTRDGLSKFIHKKDNGKTFYFSYKPKYTGAHYFMGYYRLIRKDTPVVKFNPTFSFPIRFYVKGKKRANPSNIWAK